MNEKRSKEKARPVVTVAELKSTLRTVWPQIGAMLEVARPHKAGRHDRYSNQQIFGTLLHAYFEGLSLRNRLSARGGPAPGSMFYKLDLWTSGSSPRLDQAWAAYLRAIPQPQLLAWRARLLGFDGPARPLKNAPRYTNSGPPPRLLRILIDVCDERKVRTP